MRIRLIVTAALVSLAGASCASTFSTAAALVDGVRVSRAELDEAVKARLAGQQDVSGAQRLTLEREALTQLIGTILTRRVAEQRNVSISDDRVEREIADVRSRFPSEDAFLERVREAGLTLETLRERFRDELLGQALTVALAPEVSAADIRSRYQAQIDQYREVEVSHILFTVDQATSEATARGEASRALARIRGGASFASLARELSKDTSSAQNGGRLPGWTAIAGLDQAFGTAAYGADPGVVTEPVRSQFGYHLILTHAKRTRPLADVRESIEGQIASEIGQVELQRELAEAGARANVRINPRYGDWDPETSTIVPHTSFLPAEPQEVPGEDDGPDGGLVPGGDGP